MRQPRSLTEADDPSRRPLMKSPSDFVVGVAQISGSSPDTDVWWSEILRPVTVPFALRLVSQTIGFRVPFTRRVRLRMPDVPNGASSNASTVPAVATAESAPSVPLKPTRAYTRP